MTFIERCEHFGTEHAEDGGQCVLPGTHSGPHRFDGAPPPAQGEAPRDEHKPDCLGWEDCRCFPTHEVRRLTAALAAEKARADAYAKNLRDAQADNAANADALVAEMSRADALKAEVEDLRGRSYFNAMRAAESEVSRLTGELRRREEEIDSAKFWVDEFGSGPLDLMTYTLYEYVLHWHRAADRLAGGAGRALAQFPPPTPEEIWARLEEAKKELNIPTRK